jgi:hypothetical protein
MVAAYESCGFMGERVIGFAYKCVWGGGGAGGAERAGRRSAASCRPAVLVAQAAFCQLRR